MSDFRKMTVESLRQLARKILGPGHSRLKTKRDLIAALEAADERSPAASGAAGAKAKPRSAGARAARATGKAVKVARAAGNAAREGARAAARAGKAAVEEVANAAQRATKPRARKAGKVAAAAAAVAGATAGAVAGVAAAVRATRRRAGDGKPGEPTPDPEGYFVARVRGEDAVREAPHPLTETTSDAPEAFRAVEEAPAGEGYREDLGELPWGYGDDAFVALPPPARAEKRDQSESRARSARASSENGAPTCPGPSSRPSGISQGIRMKRSSMTADGPLGGSIISFELRPRSRSRPCRSTACTSER